MTNFLPLLNSTNRFAASATVVTPGSYGVESSKRKKCVALAAQKAAPTCTLSLTSVSVSAHGSSDALDFIPFPSSPANTTTSTSTGIPFPSTTTPILSSTKVTTACPPRPRLRSQSSLLRRRRSTARLVQPVCTADFLLPPCSSQVESEPDQLAASTPPRKRARKTSISTPSSSAPTVSAKPTSYHSLAISCSSAAQKKAKPSKKATADLRFLCTMYRSIAWLRLYRDFAQATRCLVRDGAVSGEESSMMDVDVVVPMRVSVLDAQESLLLSRLRSYLIFNETSPQWLDVTPLHSTTALPTSTTFSQEVEERMDMDVDAENHLHHQSSPTTTSTSTSPPLPPTPTPTTTRHLLPIISQEQVAASLVFRYRHRSKGKSKPEAMIDVNTSGGEETTVRGKTRRRSPLAGPDACWVPEEP